MKVNLFYSLENQILARYTYLTDYKNQKNFEKISEDCTLMKIEEEKNKSKLYILSKMFGGNTYYLLTKSKINASL